MGLLDFGAVAQTHGYPAARAVEARELEPLVAKVLAGFVGSNSDPNQVGWFLRVFETDDKFVIQCSAHHVELASRVSHVRIAADANEFIDIVACVAWQRLDEDGRRYGEELLPLYIDSNKRAWFPAPDRKELSLDDAKVLYGTWSSRLIAAIEELLPYAPSR